MQTMSRSSLTLTALRSEDIEGTPKTKVTVQIKGLGRQDVALEQLEKKIVAGGRSQLGKLDGSFPGTGMKRLLATG